MNQEYAEIIPEAAGPTSLTFMPTECIVDQLAMLNNCVSRRSYELYERRGREPGRELEDWLRAESEFLRWFPAEISDSGNDFVVRAEIRGFAAEKLEVGAAPRVVLIKAERRQPEESESRQLGYTEIHLPSDVDTTSVLAAVNDGIIVLTLTKTTSENGCGEGEHPVASEDVVAGSE